MKTAFVLLLAVALTGVSRSQSIPFPGPGVGQVSSGCTGVNGFTCLRTITIDHTKVPNTDQSNFPVLIYGTYGYLATIANGGLVANASGFDIVFTSDSGCSSILKFNRAAWSASTGASQFWVKITSLSHTTDTVLYECYGKSSITTDQQDTPNTWSNSYKAVLHLEDNAASTTVLDASGTQNFTSDSSVNTSVRTTTGEFTLGFLYNGNHLNSEDETASGANLAGVLTYSGWFTSTASNDGNFYALIGNGQVNTPGVGTRASIDSGGKLSYIDGGVHSFTSLAISTNTWYYYAVTGTGGSATATGYLGAAGGSLSSGTVTAGALAGTPNIYITGGTYDSFGPVQRLDGKQDELHISNVARSSDWINTEFNNQSAPSTFYSVSSPM